MKAFKYILLLMLGSCNFGLTEELDKSKAEALINSHIKTGELDSLLITESNAHSVIENNGVYLFVVNAFKGDFNGYIYSEKKLNNKDSLIFNHFYILEYEESEGKWTKIYGKW